MPAFARALQVLHTFLADGTAPCAVAEVGGADGAWWRAAEGRLVFGPHAPAASEDTVFDLASVTKVLATTTLAMQLCEAGRIALDTPVGERLPAWRGEGRDAVRVVDLLSHAAGLPAHRPYGRTLARRASFERAICAEPLEYVPRTTSIYSDLGFMLLGFVLEDAAGDALDRRFEMIAAAAGAAREIGFRVLDDWRGRLAPTSDDPARQAVVDDANAAALGGSAGHAGLFGTARGVGLLARAWLAAATGLHAGTPLASQEMVRRFTSRAGVPGSSRGLGWDTMLPTSSCGSRMSAQAFGHTGFTGTSLWVDPQAGLYAVLLTNRVYPTRENNKLKDLRPAFHDAVMSELGRQPLSR